MKIVVSPQEKSSLVKEIPIELGSYTVFAGENNSGKTSIVRGIIKSLGEENVIYIPAESIDPTENIKTGSGTDPMTKAISGLLEIVLDKTPIIGGGFKNLFDNIKNNFDSFGVKRTKLKLDAKQFEKKNFEKWIKDNVAKAILEYAVIDSHYGDAAELSIDVKQVGQGVQRLIIVSIIEEIEKISLSNGGEKILLFEEPEIYLHPKLKERLHDSLIKLSEQKNIKVVITTHDPYFIRLADQQKIYQVTRGSKGATEIKEVINKSLPKDWRSFSEINYEVFGVEAEDYLNQLYGYVESLKAAKNPDQKRSFWKDVDNDLAKKEKKDKTRKHLVGDKMTMTSYIRHEIHHRTNEKDYKHEDLTNGILNLQEIIKNETK